MEDLEAKVLSAVLEDKQIHVLLQANPENIFTTHKDIWLFIRDYYEKNMSVPPQSIVVEKFRDFEPAKNVGATKYHVEELRHDYLSDKVRSLLKSSAHELQENRVNEALNILISQSADLKKSTADIRDIDVVDLEDAVAYFKHVEELNKLGSHGIKTGLDGFDNYLPSGIMPGQFGILLAYPAIGKPATMDTMIATPNGWVRNGDLKVNDYVIGSNGKATKVIAIHDQGTLDAYRVTLSDGASVVVGPDHDWTVYSRDTKYNSDTTFTKTTLELLDDGLHYKDNRIPKRNVPVYKWFLPIVDPVEYNSKDLSIEPYTLGILLGDGSMTRETVYFTSNDEFCAEEIQRRNPDLIVNKNKGGSAQKYSITPRLMEKIRTLNLNKNSHEKGVPEDYMVSSKNQRLDLLRGLMDSDGSVIKNNRAFFHTTNKMLAEDVQQLVWSLGGVAQIRSSDRTKEEKGIEYRVAIWTPDNPFLLPRKAENYSPRPWYRAIHSIEKVGQDEMRCITVDAEDHLYVTENYIVTHNSWLALYLAVQAWKNNKKPLFISLEMTESEVRNRAYTIMAEGRFSHRKMSAGDFDIQEFERWGQKYFVNTPSFQIVSNDGLGEVTPAILRGKIDQYTPDIVFVDYIQLMQANNYTENEVVKIKNISRELKLLAISEQVPVVAIASATPDDATNMNTVPTLGQVAWSKQLAYDADWVLALGREPSSDVLEACFRKNRHGYLGEFIIQVDFDKGRFLYKDYEDT